MPRMYWANGSTAGSIIQEWNACRAGTRRNAARRRPSSSSKASMAASGPAATHCPGPFNRRQRQRPVEQRKNLRLGQAHGEHRSARQGLHHPPARGHHPQALFQRKYPARQAATNSPALWPSIAAGSIPHCFHRHASAYAVAKRAGCATAVSDRRARAPSTFPGSGYRASRRSSPSKGCKIDAHVSIASRYVG